jgi:hypothetical protein
MRNARRPNEADEHFLPPSTIVCPSTDEQKKSRLDCEAYAVRDQHDGADYIAPI